MANEPRDATADAIRNREPKFVNIGKLYLARRAPDPDGLRFIMELTSDDIMLMLVGLSKLLPANLKLVQAQGDEPLEIDEETADRMHALGDSAREMLIRATQPLQHRHMWHGLLSELGDDATLAEQAVTAYASEVAHERSDDDDNNSDDDGDDNDDDSPAPVAVGPAGVTVANCGTIIDT